MRPGLTSVWPSLYTAQPIYSLSIPGPLSPIASIFLLLMVIISPIKHHPKKETACASLAANPLVWHSSECCPNPLSFQQGSPLSLFRLPAHPFELPRSSYPFPFPPSNGLVVPSIEDLMKNQCQNQTTRSKSL